MYHTRLAVGEVSWTGRSPYKMSLLANSGKTPFHAHGARPAKIPVARSGQYPPSDKRCARVVMTMQHLSFPYPRPEGQSGSKRIVAGRAGDNTFAQLWEAQRSASPLHGSELSLTVSRACWGENSSHQ